MIKDGGWIWFLSGKEDILKDDKCGKWMYFFKDQEFAQQICQKAIDENICYECKCTDMETWIESEGVICFYLNSDDIENHKRVIQFMKDNGLIQKTKSGKLYNISFKFDSQTSEKYFDEYLHRCNKIKDLHTIEYVYLSGKYKKKWCNRIIQVMKGFVWESIIISMINIFYNEIRGLSIALGIIALVGISKFLISRSQQMDSEYVYVILIRLVYDDWGYYLTYADNKNKFVGTVQMIELSKYHKYVHSFLDIVALCRAVAINDQLEGTNRMSIITSNLSELFENYSDDGDCKQDRNWVTLLPLWAATLFEFSVTGTVNADAKPVLLEYADASARFDISMFLQSFWVDMKRKELSDGVAEFVQAFERELYVTEA